MMFRFLAAASTVAILVLACTVEEGGGDGGLTQATGNGGSAGSAGVSPVGAGASTGMGGATGSAGASNPATGVGGVIISGGGGTGGSDGGTGGECEPNVVGLLRDFTEDHPNFEGATGAEEGIVAVDLGTDKKPVFAGDGLSTVTNAADFDQWYRDVPGVNMTFEHTLPFVQSANGTAVFDTNMFFPLNGRGFEEGNPGDNFHFTFELHMRFLYSGGEVFTFRGDDDVFVFINNKLALDLGGVHVALEGSIDLDAQSADLGIVAGNEYDIDMFQAERHRIESNFRVETNLAFTNCDPIIIR
jgi:fibro-slime domain-containing protein